MNPTLHRRLAELAIGMYDNGWLPGFVVVWACNRAIVATERRVRKSDARITQTTHGAQSPNIGTVYGSVHFRQPASVWRVNEYGAPFIEYENGDHEYLDGTRVYAASD